MITTGAIVLGGGLSRRYGRDKLSAPWSGSTLFAHVRAALPAEVAEVLLVLRTEQEPVAGVDRVVHDDPTLPDGPLRGMVAGMRSARCGWNWILACDLPQLRTSMLELLAVSATASNSTSVSASVSASVRGPVEAAAGDDATASDDTIDAVVFRHAGHVEPLVALYHRRCLPAFEAALAAGDSSPRRALEQVRVRWIDEEVWRAVDPDGASFLNVNSPDLDRRAAGTEDLR